MVSCNSMCDIVYGKQTLSLFNNYKFSNFYTEDYNFFKYHFVHILVFRYHANEEYSIAYVSKTVTYIRTCSCKKKNKYF